MPTTGDMVNSLAAIAQGQELRIRLLEAIVDRQQTFMERQDQRLEETRREAEQAQWFWMNLAQKEGWLDGRAEEESP